MSIGLRFKKYYLVAWEDGCQLHITPPGIPNIKIDQLLVLFA